MFCCWIISHTLQMAQKVPLRPPPFLNTEWRDESHFWVPSPRHLLILKPYCSSEEWLLCQMQGSVTVKALTWVMSLVWVPFVPWNFFDLGKFTFSCLGPKISMQIMKRLDYMSFEGLISLMLSLVLWACYTLPEYTDPNPYGSMHLWLCVVSESFSKRMLWVYHHIQWRQWNAAGDFFLFFLLILQQIQQYSINLGTVSLEPVL
jgi:hypothetical protein